MQKGRVLMAGNTHGMEEMRGIMSRNEFSDLGEQIKDIVQGAVKNMDFEKLNRDISGTVGRALDEVKSNMGISRNQWTGSGNGGGYRYRGSAAGPGVRPPGAQPWDRGGTARQTSGWNGPGNSYGAGQAGRSFPRTVIGRAKGAVGGILASVFGAIGTFSFGMAGISVLASFAAGFLGTGVTIVSLAVLAPLFLISAGVLAAGIRVNGRNSRFKRYGYRIGRARLITMEERAASIGKYWDFVRKDVRRMIQDGMFPFGHIDPEQKYLILNDETYRLYQATRVQQMEMKREEEKQQEARQERQKDEKLEKVIASGEEYAAKIRAANMELKEKEISLKLTRLEAIIRRIFQCVELNPDKLPDIEKFTEYYLPTTLKLVNTYRDFEKEPIQGDNIKKAKEEINQTLNTIIRAFENLLDSMYEDVAMDISTDISVLETMLKQEGLTDSDFQK